MIKFENISKQYRLGLVSTRTLKHDINRWWQTTILRREDPYLKIGETNIRSQKGNSDYVWALRDINFSVQQGDILGIIGKNGAGKSTLLKILSRITTPTTGIIEAHGRIASLLEIGTGFHPELTGRENIYLNGCILGMTKPEIKQKIDEIVEFGGVKRYIDTPVKRYSSGMIVRLGFSVAAHLEPDILVVDEVLAVGDAEFQKKAIGKMQDVANCGQRTILFVSHNMSAVRKLCNNGILLEDGKIIFSGNISEVIDKYLETDINFERTNIYHPKNNIVKEVSARQIRDKIVMTLKYESDTPIKQPNFAFTIYDNYENPLFGTNTYKHGITDFGISRKKGEVKIELIAPYLVNGSYPVSMWLCDGAAVENSDDIFQGEKCLVLNIENMNDTFIYDDPNDGPIIPVLKYTFS
ncbi:MAG: ABC transporter ATP-binding protein [Marinilabiliaceae bacterium]|nr:ABC transporter ATP-binding protein [Marinilabiliaceae bacterium]